MVFFRRGNKQNREPPLWWSARVVVVDDFIMKTTHRMGMAGMPLFAHVGRKKKLRRPLFTIKFSIENPAFWGLQNKKEIAVFLRSSAAQAKENAAESTRAMKHKNGAILIFMMPYL